MLVLVFDTETTGLPQSKIISPDTLQLWPHIVQFSYLIYDTELNEIVQTSDKIVNLIDGITITEESIKIHGITNELCKKEGISIGLLLCEFFYSLKNVDLLVGHNILFDINMLKIELLRIIYGKYPEEYKKLYKNNLHYLTNYKNISCTLKDSINICNIESVDKVGKPYLKYPKLIELHEKLFNKSPNNLHNSFNDILVTLRCFMKLKHDIDLNVECESFKKYTQQIGLF